MYLYENQTDIHKNFIFLNESIFFNQKDIYYNKDKFDSGMINLCFITGLSGSGKTTMGEKLSEENNIECYCLDDVIFNWNFSDRDLKRYGDLIYSFFKGVGKKFRYHSQEEYYEDPFWNNRDDYGILVIQQFVKYAIKYSEIHYKNKFIIEGVWLFKFFEPDYFDNYAFFIKGTSMIISKMRANIRDSSDAEGTFERIKVILKQSFRNWNGYIISEKEINKFYKYFSNKVNNN